jgi:hypothetical protein
MGGQTLEVMLVADGFRYATLIVMDGDSSSSGYVYYLKIIYRLFLTK